MNTEQEALENTAPASAKVDEVPPAAESDREHALRVARLAMSNQRAYWFRR